MKISFYFDPPKTLYLTFESTKQGNKNVITVIPVVTPPPSLTEDQNFS